MENSVQGPVCDQKTSPLEMKGEKKTLLVALFTFVTMFVEIAAGLWTGSMALLADGYHMATHAAALFLSYVVYRLYRSQCLEQKLNFGTGKVLSLGGFASCCFLGLAALWIIGESFWRFFHPKDINFKEALIVAAIGLVVNLISYWFLTPKHDHHHDHHHGHDHDHDHHHHDTNLQSAVAHVLADLVTSVAALVALAAGLLWNWYWLDPVMGLVGGGLILHWAWGIGKKTSLELLDAFPENFSREALADFLRQNSCELVDFHLWRHGPEKFICTLSVRSQKSVNNEQIEKWLSDRVGKVHLTLRTIKDDGLRLS